MCLKAKTCVVKELFKCLKNENSEKCINSGKFKSEVCKVRENKFIKSVDKSTIETWFIKKQRVTVYNINTRYNTNKFI